MPRAAKKSKAAKISFSFPNTAIVVGYLCLGLSLFIFLNLFFRPAKEELVYQLRSTSSDDHSLTPANRDFSIVIPTIGATSEIVANVNPYDSRVYQQALTHGVAHAQGTGFPGEGSNIFLFAHSSANLFEASRFNSVFYLMHHLVVGDQIILWYHNQGYLYEVTDKLLVSPQSVQYLKPNSAETLTLMTCYPPGTTLKRLIVVAKPIQL